MAMGCVRASPAASRSGTDGRVAARLGSVRRWQQCHDAMVVVVAAAVVIQVHTRSLHTRTSTHRNAGRLVNNISEELFVSSCNLRVVKIRATRNRGRSSHLRNVTHILTSN